MKRIVQLKLVTSPDDRAALLATLERANAAANALSDAAWLSRTCGKFPLQKATYYEIKARFGLSAQLVVRVTAKVVDAYKRDRTVKRRFRRRGSIAYDDRIVRYSADHVSLWTVTGRRSIPFLCDERARQLLAFRQGESDLVYRQGDWYLFATVEIEEPPVGDPQGFLGIDLGIKAIAADSDGTPYAGGKLRRYRRRSRRVRRRLQARRTRGARRLLVKRRNRVTQAEFRCIQCALEGHADLFAALEIARRATVSWANCRAGDGPLERTPKCAIGKARSLGDCRMPPASAVG